MSAGGGTATSALTRMRVNAFVRSGRTLAPLLAALVVLAVLHGGGAAPAGEAYGVSAVALFPVLAWQAKLVLDAEPDVQRRIARVTVGPRRELVAGVLAAAVPALVTVVVALVLPGVLGAIRAPRSAAEPSLVTGVALGIWAHLLAAMAGVAMGALASRSVTREIRYGVLALVSGAVGAIVLGLKSSVAPWLAPPLMGTARALSGSSPGSLTVLALTGHAVLWSAVALAGFGWLRRTRS